MPSTNFRGTSKPYLAFFTLWTQEKTTFQERIRVFRKFFRLNALEILRKMFEGTLLRRYALFLQHITQDAQLLILSGKSTEPATIAFLKFYPGYFFAMSFVCFMNYQSRAWRTNLFYETPKKLVEPLINRLTDNQFNGAAFAEHKKNSKNIDNLIDIPKTYYNVSQSLFLLPLEAVMYLSTLGPSVLFTMISVIGAVIFAQHKLSQSDDHLGQNLSNAKDNLDNATTRREFCDRLNTVANASREQKYISIFKDLIKNSSVSFFQLALMFLCFQFVISGNYDMAIVMGQTMTALGALASINKHIEVLANHKKFSRTIDKKIAAFSFATGNNFQDLIADLPIYQLPFWQYLSLCLSITLIAITWAFFPLPNILLANTITLSSRQMVNIALTTYLILYAYVRNTAVESIGTQKFSTLLQMSLLCLGIACFSHICSVWPLAQLPSFNQIVLYTWFTTSFTMTFYKHLFKPVCFAFDQIFTWLLQELTMLFKIPGDMVCYLALTTLETLPKFKSSSIGHSARQLLLPVNRSSVAPV